MLAATAPAEVVVVDDGSRDGTAELLAERAAAEPRLRPVVIENGGLSAARLVGARHATGEVVLLLDDDVIPASGIAAGHARHHAGADDLLVLGYMPVAPGPTTRRSYPRDIYARTYESHVRAWEAHPDRILRALWAGHLSLRRDALLALESDLADANLPYHEDVALGLVCERAGLRAVFDRGLASRHLFERSEEQYVRDARRSGIGQREVHRRYAELLGPLDDDFPVTGLPAPAAWLVRRSEHGRWPRRVVGALVTVAGLLRLWRVQRFAAGALLWRMEQIDGAAAPEPVAADRPAPTPSLR